MNPLTKVSVFAVTAIAQRRFFPDSPLEVSAPACALPNTPEGNA